VVNADGWDGISVDLESLTARDTPGLTSFVQTLHNGLGPAKTISIDLQNSTRPSEFAAAGYDLQAIARTVDEVVLLVAGYGYAWRPHSKEQVSDERARALAAAGHAKRRFDRRAGEWTATLRDGSTLWWSDARSYRLRVALARRLHLQGLAVWSLGLSDPITTRAR
jgi:spore germination protein YaaH